MDFNFSPEQEQLRDTVNRFIEREYQFNKQRHAIIHSAEGFSEDVWRGMAEIGVLGIGIPEQYGGFGGTAVDTLIVMEALGRALVVEPYSTTAVLCASLIALAANEAQKQALLPQVAEGKLRLAFAHAEPGTRYELDRIAKRVVLHASASAKLLVSARVLVSQHDHAAITLFLVDRAAPGVTLKPYRTIDNQRAADIVFDKVHVGPDAIVGAIGGALPPIEHASDRAIAALCGEAVGAMSALNDSTLEYLKTRRQFGVPIGKFQALQHRMVDMLIQLEQSRSMAYLAAVKVESSDAQERKRVVSAAKNTIGRSGRFIAQQAVQMYGGMGIVDELNVSHYFRRLTAIDATFGDADYHLARFAQSMTA
jgi:alkylation response protein AidB-like acyl-CoA dehydrogenase